MTNGPIQDLANEFDVCFETKSDVILEVQDLLRQLSNIERNTPKFFSEIMIRSDEAELADEIGYEKRTAAWYVESGKFDTADGAYYNLFYREARKGLGEDRATRMAEFALEIAKSSGRSAAIDAIPKAIAVLRDETLDNDIVRGALTRSFCFKSAVAELMNPTDDELAA